jgi:hypothetical protein
MLAAPQNYKQLFLLVQPPCLACPEHLAARRAPVARASNLAQASFCAANAPAQAAGPCPGIDSILPPDSSPGRHEAFSDQSGCSTKWLACPTTPGIRTAPSGQREVFPHPPFMLVTRAGRLNRVDVGVDLQDQLARIDVLVRMHPDRSRVPEKQWHANQRLDEHHG